MSESGMGVALVSGASSGIGEATADQLAKAGYRVFGTSRRPASAANRLFDVLPLDVTRDASVDALVKEVMQRAGRMRFLRRFAPASVLDAGVRRDLRL